MNKRKIFFILSLTALLFSCGNKGDNKSSIDDIGINIDKGLVDNNISDEKETIVKTTRVNGFENKTTINKEHLFDLSYSNMGLIVIKNDTNHIGFYSMQYGKYLVKPIYYIDWVSYSVTQDSNVGFFLKIYFEDETIIYDSLGNLIFQNKINPSAVSLSTIKVDNDVFITVTSDYSNFVYYKYNNDGSVNNVPRIKEPEHIIDNESDFNFGDKYVDLLKVDLDEYGMKGYYFSRSDNLYTLFDNFNSKVCTFVVPEEAKYIIVENNIICQEVYEMTQFDSNYDFIINGKKYSYNSYSISLIDGSRTELNLNYIIRNGSAFKDNEGKYTLSLLSLQRINSDKNLESSELFLVDKNGTLQKNITGLSPTSFTKVGLNYYNEVTKVLYDSDLKEISYLGAINPILDKENEMFFGTVDGLWGAIDFNGKIVIPFQYEKIYREDIRNNKVIVQNGTKAYSFDLSNGITESIPGVTRKLFNGLYLSESDDKIIFFDTEYNVLDGIYNLDESYYVSDIDCVHQKLDLFDTEYCYVITKEMNKYSNGEVSYEYTFRTFEINDFPNSDSFNPIGNELTEYEYLGQSEEDAILLNVGMNKMHIPEYSSAIFCFTPSMGNRFEFNFGSDNIRISSIYYYEQNELNEKVKKTISLTSTSFLENNYTYFDLDENVKYYIVLRNSSNNKSYFEKELFVADGRDPYNSFEYSDAFKSEEYNYKDGTFIKFNARATLYYDIKLSSGFKVYLYDDTNDELIDANLNHFYISLPNDGPRECIFYVVRDENSKDEKFTFTINPDTSSVKNGSTIYNPIDLNNTSLNSFSIDSNKVCYFKYENTGNTPIDELLQLNLNYTVSYVEFEDKLYTSLIEESLASGTNLAIPVSLAPNETLYFALGGSSNSVIGEILRYNESDVVERNENFTVDSSNNTALFIPNETATYQISLNSNSNCVVYQYSTETNKITTVSISNKAYLTEKSIYLIEFNSDTVTSFDSKISFAYETKAEVSTEKKTLYVNGNSVGNTYLTFSNDTEEDKVYTLTIDSDISNNSYIIMKYAGITSNVDSSSKVISVVVPANSETIVRFISSNDNTITLNYIIQDNELLGDPTEQKELEPEDFGTFVFENTSDQKKTYLLSELSGTNNVSFVVYDSNAEKLLDQTNDLNAEKNVLVLNPNEKIYISYKANDSATIQLSFTEISPILETNEIAPNVDNINSFEVEEDGFYIINISSSSGITCAIFDGINEIANNNGEPYENILFLEKNKIYYIISSFTSEGETNETLNFTAVKDSTEQISEFIFGEQNDLFANNERVIYRYENDLDQNLSFSLIIDSSNTINLYASNNVDISGTQEDGYIITISANSTGYILFTNGNDSAKYEIPLFDIDNSSFTYNFTLKDGVYESGNRGLSSTLSEMRLEIKASGVLSIDYWVSSESSCDYFRIYKNGELISSYSGTNQASYSTKQIIVTSGDVIRLVYSKDGSINSGTDSVKIKNISLSI